MLVLFATTTGYPPATEVRCWDFPIVWVVVWSDEAKG